MGGHGVQGVQSMDFGVTLPEFESSSTICYVTLGKVLNLSGPQSPN